MVERYKLVLTVTRMCNLRCPACVRSGRNEATLSEAVACDAIDAAIRQIARRGTLEIEFFGGEPLLEAGLIGRIIGYACWRTVAAGIRLSLGVITSGTVMERAAWDILTYPGMKVTLCCDGAPDVHDRHRPLAQGHGSLVRVLTTMRCLIAAGQPFSVLMTLWPDSVDRLPESLEFLRNQGVTELRFAVARGASWADADVQALEAALHRSAEWWPDQLHFEPVVTACSRTTDAIT